MSAVTASAREIFTISCPAALSTAIRPEQPVRPERSQIGRTQISIREAPERPGQEEEAGREASTQDCQEGDRCPGGGAGSAPGRRREHLLTAAGSSGLS